MRHLIIGAGAAGLNAAKTIRSLDNTAIITLVSEDTKVYSRSLLHLYISGQKEVDELNFVEDNFFKKYNIEWIRGVRAIELDSQKKLVYFNDGSSRSYNNLLIASGSSPHIPPYLENLREAENVFLFGSLNDAIKIKNKLKNSQSVTILGGGLVACNLAASLVKTNKKINIIEKKSHLLNINLDKEAASSYERAFEAQGVNLYLNSLIDDILVDQEGNFQGLNLGNGRIVLSDMLIISAGVRPNVDYLLDSDLMVNRGVVSLRGKLFRDGVVVDRATKTNRENIFAAGDVCAEKIGSWQLAVRQGIVAGYNMAGYNEKMDDLFGFHNSLNIFGIPTISIGDPHIKGEDYISEIYRNPSQGIYKKIIRSENKIHSAILQGDIERAGVYQTLIKNSTDISQQKKNIFDWGYNDFYKLGENGQLLTT